MFFYKQILVIIVFNNITAPRLMWGKAEPPLKKVEGENESLSDNFYFFL